ncbi:MAG TPA: von Willebrand factor type A domain-containing protein [Arachidicoccus soli]|nr:von Willebrand factor type A domain-containing protein [Arachidicoccus soli]
MKNLIIVVAVIFTCLSFASKSNKIISGRVTDKNGKAISGVLVKSIPASTSTITNNTGNYSIQIPQNRKYLSFSAVGYLSKEVLIGKNKILNVELNLTSDSLFDVVAVGYVAQAKAALIYNRKTMSIPMQSINQSLKGRVAGLVANSNQYFYPSPQQNDERYADLAENSFKYARTTPLSTFSIDVDAASYSNIRRFINTGNLPPTDAVRVEEMINYFAYNYPQPTGKNPVNIITQVSNAPWNHQHQLVQIALQAEKVATENLPPSNLVFLIDVSGSMSSQNKLPLLISSLKLLTDQLRPEDHVAIVTYAGNAGVALPSTSGENKIKIKDVLNSLMASGSTNGAGGIEKAYEIASENFTKNGNNRIILSTDGDFNVGMSSDKELEKLIKSKRNSGIFLTVLGFGMGNYKDSKMEILADKGNGNYAYIDNVQEARKVLLNEFGGTLFTVAKDVKLQIEFNPQFVQAYRLVGYEDRLLKSEDFNNDKKDAGDMGSGHTVTAFYEIIPTGVKDTLLKNIDPLKYQKNILENSPAKDELLTVKLRYKTPKGNKSKLMTKVVENKITPLENCSQDFRFAAAVAEFGMLLKESAFKQNANYSNVIKLAENAKGKDSEGYRTAFLQLVKTAKDLKGNEAVNNYQPHVLIYHHPSHNATEKQYSSGK